MGTYSNYVKLKGKKSKTWIEEVDDATQVGIYSQSGSLWTHTDASDRWYGNHLFQGIRGDLKEESRLMSISYPAFYLW